MLAWIAPIVVFGLVIFVHELGHFIAAKLVGVYAPRFSIGFGPALFRMRRGETEYVLAALPLGGYVRMASRHDQESAFLEGGNEETGGLKPEDPGYDPDAMVPFGPRPVPESRWFESKSLPARLFIMIAGVTMNVILAFTVLTIQALQLGQAIIPTRVIGRVHPVATAPALSALQAGDTIHSINGVAVANWRDVANQFEESEGRTLVIVTNRGETRLPIGGAGQPSADDINNAIDFYVPPVIGDLLPGSAGIKGGLRGGDTIVTIDHRPVQGWSQLQEIVVPAASKAIPFEVRRGGKTLTFTVTPEAKSRKDPVTKQMVEVGMIGATPADFSTREPIGFTEAVNTGARQTWFTATGIVDLVRELIMRERSVRELGGPIAITRASVAAAQSGFENLFRLIALLSINVAVLNLLPIPILDGGQILINIAESAKGSPFSARTKEYILRVGLVAILLIFAVSTFNDLLNGFKDAMAALFG